MKYFTSELWDLINSENEEVRQQAELKWNENSQQYNNYFNCTIKKRLNKKFYNKYITCEGFHDANIKQITISNLNNIKCQVNIFINKNKQEFNIEYINVLGIKYDNINNISV